MPIQPLEQCPFWRFNTLCLAHEVLENPPVFKDIDTLGGRVRQSVTGVESCVKENDEA
mgnify:CR=1